MAISSWRNRTVLSYRKESTEPSPGFWGLIRSDPCENMARHIFPRNNHIVTILDITNFSSEILILAMDTWKRVVLFHRKESMELQC